MLDKVTVTAIYRKLFVFSLLVDYEIKHQEIAFCVNYSYLYNEKKQNQYSLTVTYTKI